MSLYNLFLQHPVICTDSRVCPSGSLFFALKGDNFNGNAFALKALQNGCAYAIVDEMEYVIDERFILVDNVLKTLQELAAYHRRQLGTKLIGITGTNGKTTTKELIAAVLSRKYNVLYTEGNLNNHIGVPLTLLKLTAEHEIGVIEMGANHPGEIKALTEIVAPDYGIITNVGKAHLEGFGSFEGVKRTKAELYDFIAKNGGKIFINADNDFLTTMAKQSGLDEKALIKYGKQSDESGENLFVEGQVVNNLPALKMQCRTNAKSFEVQTHLVGGYNAENVLAAVTIGHYFQISDKEIIAGLENYLPKNNRSQLVVSEKNTLIVDAYNANPSSMSVAIQNFAQIEAGKKLLILGDMLELGEESKSEHQNIIALLQSLGLTEILLVGAYFKSAESDFRAFDNVDQLIEYLKDKPVENNWVLIKGSRGIKLEKTIASL
jgi:UDP-N-acetylmuramoyl-tripeptide--D-alanyl-D-alanine ligase